MPAFVIGAAGRARRGDFVLGLPGGAVLGGPQHVAAHADRGLGGETEDRRGAVRPVGDDAIGVGRENGVIGGRVEDQPGARLAQAQLLFGLEALGVVAQIEDGADLAAVLDQRPRRTDRDDIAAVGPADAPARVLDRFAVRHGARERQVGERIGFAVEREEMIGVGIFVGRDIERLDAMEALGGGVDEQKIARRAGNDHALGQLLEQQRAVVDEATQGDIGGAGVIFAMRGKLHPAPLNALE